MTHISNNVSHGCRKGISGGGGVSGGKLGQWWWEICTDIQLNNLFVNKNNFK